MFVKVLTGKYTFRDADHEAAWLTVVAMNLCRDKLKARRRHAEVSLDDVGDIADEDPGIDETLREVMRLPLKSEEQRRRMMRSRSLQWLAAAACFCLVVLGAFRFSGVLGGNVTPPDGTMEQSDPPVMVGGPYEDVADADALYEKTGVRIDAPNGAEEVMYSVYDKSIAHLIFTREGVTYVVMAAAKSGDFSGVGGETLSSEMIDAKTSAVMTKVKDDFLGEKWKAAWTDGRVSYYLTCPAEADADAVKKTALDVIALSEVQS